MPSKAQKRRFQKKDHTLARTKKDSNQDKRLANVEKRIRTLAADEELKYKDTIFTATSSSTATTDLLNGIALGTTQITRLAAMIHMTSVQWKFAFTTPTSVLTPVRFRFLIVVDRQANGATPAAGGDPLAGSPAVLNNSVIGITQCPIQYENQKRFRIVRDKTVVFNPQMSLQDANPANAVVATTREFTGYARLGINVKYGDDVATIAGINTNSLLFITVTDNATNSTITGGSRIYFKDA